MLKYKKLTTLFLASVIVAGGLFYVGSVGAATCGSRSAVGTVAVYSVIVKTLI